MITQAEARGDSKPLNLDDYRDAEARGEQLLATLWRSDDWSDSIDWTYNATRESWGGATIDASTGDVVTRDTGYAIAVRYPGDHGIKTPEIVSKAKFERTVSDVRAAYPYAPYIGIFHDDDTNTIDFDPVVIVDSESDARDIATYTHAVGGAYDFSTGNGVFPYHVSSTSNAHTCCSDMGHSDPGEDDNGIDHDHCGITGHEDPADSEAA